MEGPWYVHPDWWVAIFTGLLVGVTGVLAYFTLKLWSSTKLAMQFEEAASIPRIFPRVVAHNFFSVEDRASTMYPDSPISFVPEVSFCFDNFGKSPALVQKVRFQLHLADVSRENKLLPDELEVFPFPATGSPVIEPGKQGAVYGCKLDDAVSMSLTEYRRLLKSIPGKRYFLAIEIEYEDVYGTQVIEKFVLKGMPPKCDIFEKRGGFKKIERQASAG